MIKVLGPVIKNMQRRGQIPKYPEEVENHPAYDMGIDAYINKKMYGPRLNIKLLKIKLTSAILDQYRLANNSPTSELPVYASVNNNDNDRSEISADVQNAIQYLSTEDKWVVKKILEGYTRAEIAIALSLPISTFNRQFNSIIDTIEFRRRLEDENL